MAAECVAGDFALFSPAKVPAKKIELAFCKALAGPNFWLQAILLCAWALCTSAAV